MTKIVNSYGVEYISMSGDIRNKDSQIIKLFQTLLNKYPELKQYVRIRDYSFCDRFMCYDYLVIDGEVPYEVFKKYNFFVDVLGKDLALKFLITHCKLDNDYKFDAVIGEDDFPYELKLPKGYHPDRQYNEFRLFLNNRTFIKYGILDSYTLVTKEEIMRIVDNRIVTFWRDAVMNELSLYEVVEEIPIFGIKLLRKVISIDVDALREVYPIGNGSLFDHLIRYVKFREAVEKKICIDFNGYEKSYLLREVREFPHKLTSHVWLFNCLDEKEVIKAIRRGIEERFSEYVGKAFLEEYEKLPEDVKVKLRDVKNIVELKLKELEEAKRRREELRKKLLEEAFRLRDVEYEEITSEVNAYLNKYPITVIAVRDPEEPRYVLLVLFKKKLENGVFREIINFLKGKKFRFEPNTRIWYLYVEFELDLEKAKVERKVKSVSLWFINSVFVSVIKR